MPPGGDGWYYLVTYFREVTAELSVFNIQLNVNTMCTAMEDGTGGDTSTVGCGAAVYVAEGTISFRK